MTEEQRSNLTDLLAQRYLENASTRDLERFYYDSMVDYLQSYDDAELLSELEDHTSPEEYEDILNEA